MTTTTPPQFLLEHALDAIPDRRALKDALRRVQSAPPTSGAGEAPDAMIGRLTEELLDGGDLPPDLGQRWLDASNVVERQKAEHVARTMLIERLRSSLEDVESRGADAALAVLADELAAVLDQVRAVAPHLRSVASADDAVRAGGEAPAAWKTLTELADRYAEIRSAQLRVVTLAGGGAAGRENVVETRKLIEGAGTFQRVWELDPERSIVEAIASGSAQVRDAFGAAIDWPTSWPAEARAFLLWAVTDPAANVWLPSMQQLAFAEGERLRLRRDADHRRAGGDPDRDRAKQAQVDEELRLHKQVANARGDR